MLDQQPTILTIAMRLAIPEHEICTLLQLLESERLHRIATSSLGSHLPRSQVLGNPEIGVANPPAILK